MHVALDLGAEKTNMDRTQYFTVALEIILACSVALNVYLYAQYQNAAPSSDEVAFRNEFANVLVTAPSYDFSPPITMYHALKIALESDGWNATSLQNMTVTVSLEYMQFTNSSDSTGFQIINKVTQPPQSYADVQANSTTTYRYIWDITVNRSQGFFIPPPGLYYVDAQTGDIIPHGPLF
ncbi:MAG: hypothetical protein ABSG33_09130 [Candidatus Bathyarchaeia archaeon]|jgi:hypothetical protein